MHKPHGFKPGLIPAKGAEMSKHQEHEEQEIIDRRRKNFRIGDLPFGKKPRMP
jgi:hypothetical protein